MNASSPCLILSPNSFGKPLARRRPLISRGRSSRSRTCFALASKASTCLSALEGAEGQALDEVTLHHGNEQDDGREDADGAGRRPRPVLDLLRAILGDGDRQRLGVAAGQDQAVEKLVVGE